MTPRAFYYWGSRGTWKQEFRRRPRFRRALGGAGEGGDNAARWRARRLSSKLPRARFAISPFSFVGTGHNAHTRQSSAEVLRNPGGMTPMGETLRFLLKGNTPGQDRTGDLQRVRLTS